MGERELADLTEFVEFLWDHLKFCIKIASLKSKMIPKSTADAYECDFKTFCASTSHY